VSYVTDSFDEEIVRLLRRGGVGLLPTDTIYGLSCMALDQAAVERIRSLKSRSAGKPFIILISDIKMLDLLSISPEQAKITEQYWPGPLSIILSSQAPDFLTLGTASLAVRMPDSPNLTELISSIGPITSTSANLEGEQPVQSLPAAQKLFGDKLDFYVNAGNLDNPPSTLAEIKDGKLEVVRQGAAKIDKDKEEL